MNLGNSNFVYCQGCGEPVDTIRKVSDGVAQRCCIFCGLVLDTKAASVKAFDRAIVVDDSRTLCGVLADILVERELAREVRVLHNGRDFVTELTESLVAKRPPGFVVLDVGMPVLDGIHACIVARAIERGFGISPIPIIFFSVRKCDENFRTVLRSASPSAYLNKGSAPKPEMIGDRLSAIIRQVTEKSK